MIKILAYKYPTVVDVDMQRTVKPKLHKSDAINIQNDIKKLLFRDKFNYLLIGLGNDMFVCEIADKQMQTYSRRQIAYHPHSDDLKAIQ